MRKRVDICTGAILIALASIPCYSQTRSRSSNDGSDRDLPAKTRMKSTRVIAPRSLEALIAEPRARTRRPFFDNSDKLQSDSSQLALTAVDAAQAQVSWRQWAQNAQHTSSLNVEGQSLNKILANIVYDPLAPDEEEQNFGDLLAHYEVPLVDGSDVYMESKAGTYTLDSYATQTWHQNKFTWHGNTLVKVWTFDSDWVAPGSAFDFWEPVYHAAVANGFVYDPGAGGSIFKLNKNTGSVVKRIIPSQFLQGGSIDPSTFTVSPLTADSSGNIYYNVLRTQPTGDFFANDIVDSWLVKVTPNDTVTAVSYSVLTPGAKSTNDMCENAFAAAQLPWPPNRNATPPSVPCGTQRVAINIAPAIAPDGTIYSVTRAHFISRWGYLVAVNPNLTPKWIASLHDTNGVGYFRDGCNDGTAASDGSLLPLNGAPGGCRSGAKAGVDPATNRFGGGRVLDDSSSTPTIAPDGSILYGAYTRYNYAQGHLMRFSPSGQFLKAFGFGWDITPGIYSHGGHYSIVTKNNHYSGVGSYCDDETLCPSDRTASNPASPEEYFISQLNPDMHIEWSFKNSNTLSCTRNPDGTITCVSDHPNGFEWCVNAPAIDSNGVVYANSEDGNLFAITQGGILKQKIFQQLALGAAYTPASLGGDGKIYSQNAGHLFVVGK